MSMILLDPIQTQLKQLVIEMGLNQFDLIGLRKEETQKY